MEDDLISFFNFSSKMEDNLNILANDRRPQYFGKWKTTSIVWQMEDHLNIWQMEDNLNISGN
jgi:hypothetical protein